MPVGLMGTIRPGCVHLSLEFMMRSAQDYYTACEMYGRNLLSTVSEGGNMPWCRFDTDILLPHTAIKVT